MNESTQAGAELEALYRRELRMVLHRFAREGREKLSRVLRLGGIFGVLAVVAGVLLADWFAGSIVPFLPAIAVLLFVGIGYARAHSGYRARYKEEVVRRIVSHYDAGLTYRPNGAITRAEFDAADFFRQDIDRFRGEDLIEGKVGATNIRFSELHVEDRQQRGSGKNRRTEWVTVFRGVFVVADFPKQFRGRTVVLPDTAQRFLGGLGQTLQSLNLTRGELIKLEDPEFERQFVVYGSDQIEARYLLSTSLMQRILEFRQRWRQDIYLAFVASRLYMALPSNRNRLEPLPLLQLLSYGRSPATEAAVLRRLQEYVADLELLLGIVEDLNLNRRIWA